MRPFTLVATGVAAIVCGATAAPCAFALENPALVGTVTSVIDGDTIKVQLTEGPMTVRLAHVDAPEATQQGGGAATRALDARILGEQVSLQVVAREPDDRLVAVVLHGGENVNAWMVKQGHAWAYRHFTGSPDYCAWENAARSLRRGLWNSQRLDWVAPWDWRETKRDPLFFVTDYSNASTATCIREISRIAVVDE